MIRIFAPFGWLTAGARRTPYVRANEFERTQARAGLTRWLDTSGVYVRWSPFVEVSAESYSSFRYHFGHGLAGAGFSATTSIQIKGRDKRTVH